MWRATSSGRSGVTLGRDRAVTSSGPGTHPPQFSRSAGEPSMRQQGMAKLPVSDATVKRATGRDWDEWRRVIDTAGAGRLNHGGIARLVPDPLDGGGWR